MLRQVCLYCNAYLGSVKESGETEEAGLSESSPDRAVRISHGVCPDCFPKLVAGSGQTLADFLDGLAAPVFVVDGAGCIVTANQKALQAVGKDLAAIKGLPGGEVFSCRYARLPEGCGETIHCKTCTIRLTVTHTFDTGTPCINVPAYMDLGDRTGIKTIRFVISTEKGGDMVLLRVDDMQPVS